MADSSLNQEETTISFLLQRQSKLIQVKITLGEVMMKLRERNTDKCNTEGAILAKIIYEASGDNAITSIWHLEQTMKYLEAILTDNQICIKLITKINSLAGKF